MSLFFKGRAAAVAALAALATSAFSETYAVLVGINEYPGVASGALRGCVNDVNGIEEVLRLKFGVPPANIRKAVNQGATSQAFVGHLSWAASTVKPGDQVFFYYSGFSTQVADESDEVADVLVLADQRLVPYSFFTEVASVMSTEGVNATFVFDTSACSEPSPDARFRSRFLQLPNNAPHTPMTSDELRTAKLGTKGDPVVADTPGEFLMLFAGQEDLPALDLNGSSDAPEHGLFTLNLLEALRGNPALNINELIDAVTVMQRDDLEFELEPRLEASSGDRVLKPLILR